MSGTWDSGDSELLQCLQCGAGQPKELWFHLPSRFYLPNSTQHLQTSQAETRPENLTAHTVPDQPCDQGLPEPDNSIQAKKVSVEVWRAPGGARAQGLG